MPYDNHKPQDRHVKQNIFDYVRWSMEALMNKEDQVIKYYNWFLNLANISKKKLVLFLLIPFLPPK